MILTSSMSALASASGRPLARSPITTNTYSMSGFVWTAETICEPTVPPVRSAIVTSRFSTVQSGHSLANCSVDGVGRDVEDGEVGDAHDEHVGVAAGVGDDEVGEPRVRGLAGGRAADVGVDAVALAADLVGAVELDHRDAGAHGGLQAGPEDVGGLARHGDVVGAGVDGLLHGRPGTLRVGRVVAERGEVPAEGVGGLLEPAGDRQDRLDVALQPVHADVASAPRPPPGPRCRSTWPARGTARPAPGRPPRRHRHRRRLRCLPCRRRTPRSWRRWPRCAPLASVVAPSAAASSSSSPQAAASSSRPAAVMAAARRSGVLIGCLLVVGSGRGDRWWSRAQCALVLGGAGAGDDAAGGRGVGLTRRRLGLDRGAAAAGSRHGGWPGRRPRSGPGR